MVASIIAFLLASRYRGQLSYNTYHIKITRSRCRSIDDKAETSLSLNLVSKIVTVLDCGIEDLLEVVEE